LSGTESLLDDNGVYTVKTFIYHPESDGLIEKFKTNTMYPDHWTLDTIQEETEAAWYSTNKTWVGNEWTAVSPSGVKITGHDDQSRITARPVYEPPL
jgi:hypothetical protein